MTLYMLIYYGYVFSVCVDYDEAGTQTHEELHEGRFHGKNRPKGESFNKYSEKKSCNRCLILLVSFHSFSGTVNDLKSNQYIISLSVYIW